MTCEEELVLMARALAESEKLLHEARRQVWNDYYDLPGRGRATFVLRLDALLGLESKWLDRYNAQGYETPIAALSEPETPR